MSRRAPIATLICAFLLASLPHLALANKGPSRVDSFVAVHLVPLAEHPAVVGAIRAQNAMTAGYDPAHIAVLDQQWRTETGSASDLINSVLGHQVSDFLQSVVQASNGRIFKIVLMDAQGLNVAASDMTPDYWHGDEMQHLRTYQMGSGATHFGRIEADPASQRHQAPFSLTVSDPETGLAIGAVTFHVAVARLR